MQRNLYGTEHEHFRQFRVDADARIESIDGEINEITTESSAMASFADTKATGPMPTPTRRSRR